MNLVFFLEEPSAREMLKGLLKHLLAPGINPRFIVFEGKRDLERRLVKRLRGWRLPESRFVILCDKDSADCRKVNGKTGSVPEKKLSKSDVSAMLAT